MGGRQKYSQLLKSEQRDAVLKETIARGIFNSTCLVARGWCALRSRSLRLKSRIHRKVSICSMYSMHMCGVEIRGCEPDLKGRKLMANDTLCEQRQALDKQLITH